MWQLWDEMGWDVECVNVKIFERLDRLPCQLLVSTKGDLAVSNWSPWVYFLSCWQCLYYSCSQVRFHMSNVPFIFLGVQKLLGNHLFLFSPFLPVPQLCTLWKHLVMRQHQCRTLFSKWQWRVCVLTVSCILLCLHRKHFLPGLIQWKWCQLFLYHLSEINS